MPNYDPRKDWEECQLPRGDETEYFPNLWVEDLNHLWAVHQGKVTVAVYPKEDVPSKYEAWRKAATQLMEEEDEARFNGLSDKDAEGDEVGSPPHYTVGGHEAIDVIRSKLTSEEYRGYCKGNVLKYLMRANYKGHHDVDCFKAEWYMEELSNEIQVRDEDS
jgi:hypothetical protein